jgi:hypothetical protein
MTCSWRARTTTVLVAAGFVLIGAPDGPAAAPLASGGTTQLTLTAPVRAALRKARINVLYPAVVPKSIEGVGIAVDAATGNSYSLDVVASITCVGVKTSGGACNQASVEGGRPAGPTPAGYVPVKLSDGSTGHYMMRPCGANCEGSFELTFVRWNTRYTIFVKAGTLAQGLAIERGLRALR